MSIIWYGIYTKDEGFAEDSKLLNFLKEQAVKIPEDIEFFCKKNDCCVAYLEYEHSHNVTHSWLYSPIMLTSNDGYTEEVWHNEMHCSMYDPFEGELVDYLENFEQLFPQYHFDVYEYMSNGNVPSEIRDYFNWLPIKTKIRNKCVELLQEFQLIKDHFALLKSIYDDYDNINVKEKEWIEKYGDDSLESKLYYMIDDLLLKCIKLNNNVIDEKLFHPNVRMGEFISEVMNDAMEYNLKVKAKNISNLYVK